MTPLRYLPSGEAALLVEFPPTISPLINQHVHALAAVLNAAALPGLREVVPAYRTLLVHYELLETDFDSVRVSVEALAANLETNVTRTPRRVEIPALYTGPDLEFIAAYARLSVPEVIARHTGVEYRVYMMGFTPGFAYMGEVDERIAAPRLESPRTRVPAGSIGIAGQQTGIYPLNSPGGWRLIGHTPLILFDLSRPEPFLLTPGDIVKFVAEERAERTTSYSTP